MPISCFLPSAIVWDGYWICANPASWNRLPNDIKAIVAKVFNEVALLERDDLNKLDRSLQGELEKKGVTFTKPNIDSFRDKLRSAGFYQEWRGKVGNEAWTLLEKYVGKLGLRPRRGSGNRTGALQTLRACPGRCGAHPAYVVLYATHDVFPNR